MKHGAVERGRASISAAGEVETSARNKASLRKGGVAKGGPRIGAPKPKLDNEKPKGKTVRYEELLKTWRDSMDVGAAGERYGRNVEKRSAERHWPEVWHSRTRLRGGSVRG